MKNYALIFKDILIELCDDSFVDSLITVLHAILIPEMKCAICWDLLLMKSVNFFKSGEGNCHLFHKDCLSRSLEEGIVVRTVIELSNTLILIWEIN